jgi:hypothetical protein
MTSAPSINALHAAVSTLALCLALGASSAQAQASNDADGCAEGFLERVTLALGDATSLPHEAPVFAACQPWPEHPGQAIVAFARPREGAGSYELQVLILEHRPDVQPMASMPRILARFAQGDSFVVDSMSLSSIRIDTAAWHLAPGLNAFGVRSTTNIRSSTALQSEDVLRLYRRDSTLVIPVIDPLVVNATDGVWDTQCAGQATQLYRHVAVVPGNPAQPSTLLITESLVDTENQLRDGACTQRELSRVMGQQKLQLKDGYFPSPRSVVTP